MQSGTFKTFRATTSKKTCQQNIAHIYERSVDVVGELLASSHGEDHSVEVVCERTTVVHKDVRRKSTTCCVVSCLRGLTWDDLQHSVLLHVGRKVPGSHVLLHYANIGQLLTGGKQDAHQNGGHPSQREKYQNMLGKKNFRGLSNSLFFLSEWRSFIYLIIIPKSSADLWKKQSRRGNQRLAGGGSLEFGDAVIPFVTSQRDLAHFSKNGGARKRSKVSSDRLEIFHCLAYYGMFTEAFSLLHVHQNKLAPCRSNKRANKYI